jgi:hypothetical protein
MLLWITKHWDRGVALYWEGPGLELWSRERLCWQSFHAILLFRDKCYNISLNSYWLRSSLSQSIIQNHPIILRYDDATFNPIIAQSIVEYWYITYKQVTLRQLMCEVSNWMCNSCKSLFESLLLEHAQALCTLARGSGSDWVNKICRQQRKWIRHIGVQNFTDLPHKKFPMVW